MLTVRGVDGSVLGVLEGANLDDDLGAVVEQSDDLLVKAVYSYSKFIQVHTLQIQTPQNTHQL